MGRKLEQDALEKAMAELEELEKSQDDDDGIDEMIKALEEEIGDLNKSDDEEDGDGESGEDGEDGGDDEGEDEDGEDGEDGEDVNKSEDNEEFTEELIKASEAYASLEKSVSEGIGEVNTEVSELKKSMSSLLALNVKQAKVIGSLFKAVKEMGAAPIGRSRTELGLGGSRNKEEMEKSVPEITELLLKAVQENKIDAHYLSMYGTYKTTDVLPDEVKTAIGI